MRTFPAGVLMLLASLCWPPTVQPAAAAESVQDFYAGRQVTVIVGSGAGGGYDLQARLMARHLGKHIPGNPTFIVQNMPGPAAWRRPITSPTRRPPMAARSRCSSAAC